MAAYAHVDVLDGGPEVIRTAAIRALVVVGYSLADNYATVLGKAIATAVISSADFGKSGADGAPRVLTFTGKTAVATGNGGLSPSLSIAFTDGASRVLWVTPVTCLTQIYIGNTVTIPALTYSRGVMLLALDMDLLAEPLYFAHAGNKLMWPEESTTAFAASVAAGENFLDIDSHTLSTGEVVLMHDTTVDRTTSGTGNVSSKSLAQWNALTLDPTSGAWFGGGYPDTEAPPILSTVLATYINTALFSIENKANSAALTALLNELSSAGVSANQAVISSFDSSQMAAVNASGYKSMFLTTSGGESAATVAGYGVDWVGVGTGTSSGQVTAYLGAGLKVAVWTINRHVDRDLWVSRGVNGIYSDDTKYIRATAAMRTTDNFASQTWDHGMIASDDLLTAGSRGQFFSTDKWGYSSSETTFRGCLMGFLCPVASPSNFMMDLKITFDSANAGDATRWAAVALHTTDAAYVDTTTNKTCYHILFRKNGSVEIWYRDGTGAASNLVTTTGSTIADGAEKIFRITVTSTDIKAAQIDGTGADITPATTPHAIVRPAYISLNRNGLACKFRDITIT